MKLLKPIVIAALSFLAIGWCSAQSSPSVSLTINSNAPGTATILRSTGNCPATGVPASGTTLSNSVSVTASGSTNAGTYTDSTVAAGNSYCYWATLQASGGGSGVSNTFLGSIGVTVTLSGKVN